MIDEFDSSSALLPLQNRYELGAGEVVKGELRNEPTNYYFSDALGSTTNLSQISGTQSFTTSTAEYDSFGKVNLQTGASANSIGYTGQRLDTETGLMALGNGERYYSPALARFTQQDSFSGMLATAQSLNRYSYSYNNPLKYRDPSGNLPTVVAGALVGAVAGFLIDAAHQAVDIYNGDQKDGFHFGQALMAAGTGAVLGAVIGTGVGALALLGYGAAATVGVTAGGVVVGATSFAINYQDGRTAHGAIDLAASLIPFGSKGVRGSFGEFAAGGYNGTGVGTFRQNIGNFRANGGASQFKQLLTGGQPEVLQESKTSLETEPRQLTDGGRGNQKLLGDGGVAERISKGRLLNAAPGEFGNELLTRARFTADTVRFSQNSVSYNKINRLTGERFTYDDLVESMKTQGWKGDPVDVVEMPDGRVTSMDNTRIRAARETSTEVEAIVRNGDDLLTPSEIERFRSDKFPEPETWSDAIMIRINRQSSGFSKKYPFGSDELPKVKGKPE